MSDDVVVSRDALHKALLRVLSPSMATKVLNEVERIPRQNRAKPTELDRRRARDAARRAGLEVKG